MDRSGLYNISRRRTHPESYLPLYRSKNFTSTLPPMQPIPSRISSKAASRPSDTSSCCPLSSPAYLCPHAAERVLPSALPLHLAGLRPPERDLKDREPACGGLPYPGVQVGEHSPVVLPRPVRPVQVARAPPPHLPGRRNDLLQPLRHGDPVLRARRTVGGGDSQPPQARHHSRGRREKVVLSSAHLLIQSQYLATCNLIIIDHSNNLLG